MPARQQPPYEAGALLQPRQLQRWLDVNKVTKLTRTQTFWTIPAFDISGSWLGYSQLVAAFNFTATNNFSLPLGYSVPDDPHYVLCIMWVDEDYNVYRYSLWRDVGEVFFFDAPVYSGQLIKKNFRIEVWDAEPTSVLSFILNGAGTITVNEEYTYLNATTWEGTGGTPNITLTDGVWTIENNLSQDYYSAPDNNFPFVVWTVGGFGNAPTPYGSLAITMTMSADITLYTSVAGQYDYMWQTDGTLATASAIITDFSVSLNGNSAFDLPMEWPADSVPTLN